MKMLSRISLLLLVTTALSLSAHGEELETPQMGKLTPQMQARLLQLLGAEVGSIDPASSASATSGGLRPLVISPVSTALRTGSLRTGHLETSSSLSGDPRLSDDEWRRRFPLRR